MNDLLREVANERPWITDVVIRLDPSKDSVEWKEDNQKNPFINIEIADSGGDPRLQFDVGHGSVRAEFTKDGIDNALDTVLKSMRVN